MSQSFVQETYRQAVPEVDAGLLLYFAVSASILDQTDTVRFSHQLLQEYFAAYEMGEDLKRGIPADKYFRSEEWWTPTGWEETVLLLAGMLGDATEVARWLTPVQPDLAYRVATESGASCDSAALRALYEPEAGARRSPYAVAEWGRLNHEHDTRPGVRLRPDGLPDIAWCDIPAGKFLYGDSKQEREIPYSFKMAKYPVTFIQFQSFIESDEFADAHWWRDFPEEYRPQIMVEQHNPYYNHPRDSVSWYQAVAFSRWLDTRYRAAGLIGGNVMIRLPIEQEWEYAARGKDGREYPWGDGYRVGHANVDEQEQGVGPYFLYKTTAVDTYPQGVSPFGVLDMSGNVWEWCLNDYQNQQVVDGYSDGSRKVLRSGSFVSIEANAICANRDFFSPNRGFSSLGLRLVLAPPTSTQN